MNNPAQGTREWLLQRVGKVTASRIADLTARTKSGYGASRANYAAQIITERLTGNPTETFVNAAMQHGVDTEPQARAAYALLTGHTVLEVGYTGHPTIKDSGCSCDGFVNDNGLVEIKCPNSATHLETVLAGDVPEKYLKQIMWQMACTGKEFCDFVSFDPRMPSHLQIKIIPVKRDEEMIRSLTQEVIIFLAEIDQKIKSLALLEAA